MNQSLRRIVWIALLSSMVAVPALALGPVDGEIGALWWANEYESGHCILKAPMLLHPGG